MLRVLHNSALYDVGTLVKDEFANDVVLLACTREAACAAVMVYVEVAI